MLHMMQKHFAIRLAKWCESLLQHRLKKLWNVLFFLLSFIVEFLSVYGGLSIRLGRGRFVSLVSAVLLPLCRGDSELSLWVFVSLSGFNCHAQFLPKIQMNLSDMWDFAGIECLNSSVYSICTKWEERKRCYWFKQMKKCCLYPSNYGGF